MYEEKRFKYKPEKVKILFIGESRPIGGKFFYLENSILFRETKKVFENLLETDFDCNIFKKLGCWLYDVCDVPVNNLLGIERTNQIIQRIPKLLEVISKLKPEYIIVIKLTNFADLLREPLEDCGYIGNDSAFYTAFPACGNQARYRKELTSALKEIFNRDK